MADYFLIHRDGVGDLGSTFIKRYTSRKELEKDLSSDSGYISDLRADAEEQGQELQFIELGEMGEWLQLGLYCVLLVKGTQIVPREKTTAVAYEVD